MTGPLRFHGHQRNPPIPMNSQVVMAKCPHSLVKKQKIIVNHQSLGDFTIHSSNPMAFGDLVGEITMFSTCVG